MIEQTYEQLKGLRLSAFLVALREQLSNSHYQDLAFEERLSLLVEAECLQRKNTRIYNLLKQAKLKDSQACVESIDFCPERGLVKSRILDLTNFSWIHNYQNLIVTGPTGAGKSFLACALGRKACQGFITTRYFKVSTLLQEIALAKASQSYFKFIRRAIDAKLIILDEWLRDPLDPTQAREILDLLDERYQKSSTIFCSQIPVNLWQQQIKEPTIADAILDRVAHNSIRIELAGESFRKKLATQGKRDTVANAPLQINL
ncbi:MAG: IS21-like element helper ATPase IstB [Bacteroidales bacterium]|nr:IS21-like element helper ATPase IstB [Bacteroidales bacterium]